VPRTPLLRIFIRAQALAREAAARGIPLRELSEMRRADWTRRRLLRTSAAAAGATAVGACASSDAKEPAPARSGAAVAIVGGGIAGLHCAHRLRRSGVQATVYEGSNRVGGRILSDRKTFAEGLSAELGAELIDSGHTTMLDLAEELGIDLHDFTKDDPALSGLWAHVGGRVLTESEILEGFAPVAARIDEALATQKDPEGDITYSEPNGAEALDRTSIRAWLDAGGFAGPVRGLLDVAYLTEYGLETDDSSALNLLTMISTEAGKFEVFGESDERYRAKEGNDLFTTRLAERLDPAQIVLGHKLLSVRRAPDGRHLLTFATDGGTKEATADHVVLAVPFTLLRDVELPADLPETKVRAVRELGYGMNAKLMAGFSSRVWRAQGSDGSVFTDVPFQCSWETSRLQPGAAGIMTNFTGGRHAVTVGGGTVKEQLDSFLGGFERVFAGSRAASDGRVARMHWPTNAWIKASYASYRVGQWTTLRGAEGEAAGTLHFCGEHTSLDAQGFMEGGAESGARAAEEVASDLGLTAEAYDPRDPSHRIVARTRRRALLRNRGLAMRPRPRAAVAAR